MNYLKVIKLENLRSESGVDYIMASFRPVNYNENTGSAIPASAEFGKRTFFPGAEPMLGEVWGGKVYHFDTTPYLIGERENTTIKVVAFEDEVPVDVANAILERSNACVLTNGKPTKKLKKTAKPAVEEETE